MKFELEYFRSFYEKEAILEFEILLKENSIRYSIEYPSKLLDSNIVGSGNIQSIVLKVLRSDFVKLNGLLKDKVHLLSDDEIMLDVLNTYGDDDLLDIARDPNNWSVEEVEVSKRILTIRGLHELLDKAEIDSLANEYPEGEPGSLMWQLTYMLFVTIGHYVSIVFPIAGIGMGYYYAYIKEVDKNGLKSYKFDGATRVKGLFVFYGGIIFMILLMAYIVTNDYWSYYLDNIMF